MSLRKSASPTHDGRHWSVEETSLIAEHIKANPHVRQGELVKQLIPLMEEASKKCAAIRSVVDRQKLVNKVGNVRNALGGALQLAASIAGPVKKSTKKTVSADDDDEEFDDKEESIEEEKPRRLAPAKRSHEETEITSRVMPSPHPALAPTTHPVALVPATTLSTDPKNATPSSSSNAQMSPAFPHPPDDLDPLVTSWKLKTKSCELDSVTTTWLASFTGRLPAGMVRYAIHRKRENALFLALFPPFGWDLSIDVDEEGYICLKLERIGVVDAVENWYQILDEEFGKDSTGTAYPVVLPVPIKSNVFLPIHPMQDLNGEPVLKRMDFVLEICCPAYTLCINLVKSRRM